MADAQEKIGADELVTRLKKHAEGVYDDDVSSAELKPPESMAATGFDLGGDRPRVRLRPELGFSDKRVVGPGITLVKRFYLRLLFHVFDDLARQTDAALERLESSLAVEIAERERLERRVAELEGGKRDG